MIGLGEWSVASEAMVRSGAPYGGAGAIPGSVASGSERSDPLRASGLRVDHHSEQRVTSPPNGRPEIDSGAQVAVAVNRRTRARGAHR